MSLCQLVGQSVSLLVMFSFPSSLGINIPAQPHVTDIVVYTAPVTASAIPLPPLPNALLPPPTRMHLMPCIGPCLKKKQKVTSLNNAGWNHFPFKSS